MITKESLIENGVDYEKGMKVCLNNESFYFRLIGQCLANEKFAELGKNLEAKDLKSAFESAHALKGITGNLALTPLQQAVEAIVEPLRANDETKDYNTLYNNIMQEKAKLDALV